MTRITRITLFLLIFLAPLKIGWIFRHNNGILIGDLPLFFLLVLALLSGRRFRFYLGLPVLFFTLWSLGTGIFAEKFDIVFSEWTRFFRAYLAFLCVVNFTRQKKDFDVVFFAILSAEKQIVWKENPYVIFDEGTEVERRYKMRAHEPWQPEGLVLGLLRKHVDVSSRAERSKRLRGSVDEGFRSLPAISTGAANTLSFTRDWKLDFAEDKVRIVIVDSLGGSELLGEMEEATVFEITARGPDDELLGSYSEGTKSGTLRMIRSKERRVVK